MAGRKRTTTTAGGQRHDADSRRPVEAFRAEVPAEDRGDDERATGGASQPAGSPATERMPASRSRFLKLPGWATMPVEVKIWLGTLVAAAVIVLLVLSRG